MKTNIYVDAFNLYYGSLRRTPYKWLNLHQLAVRLLKPHHRIEKIVYCTALVSGREQRQRQELYLRALRTLPSVEILVGHFLTHPKTLYTVTKPSKPVKVWVTEEKGSDVNLATALLADALTGATEAALVVSNDSDLCAPVERAIEYGVPVGIAIPAHAKPSIQLRKVATFHRFIRDRTLAQCQFPAKLTDKSGEFFKPRNW